MTRSQYKMGSPYHQKAKPVTRSLTKQGAEILGAISKCLETGTPFHITMTDNMGLNVKIGTKVWRYSDVYQGLSDLMPDLVDELEKT